MNAFNVDDESLNSLGGIPSLDDVSDLSKKDQVTSLDNTRLSVPMSAGKINFLGNKNQNKRKPSV